MDGDDGDDDEYSMAKGRPTLRARRGWGNSRVKWVRGRVVGSWHFTRWSNLTEITFTNE